ncbi:MAG: hypothetical protein Q4C14_08500, partial [Bacillota bacterium]|nr:hypothetical protein [Bacillota bacterium]
SGLVEEGVRQGICSTKYPETVIEMTILYANTAFDDLNMAGLSRKQQERKIAGFIYNMERLLGMEEGSLQDAIMPIFRQNLYNRKHKIRLSIIFSAITDRQSVDAERNMGWI